MRQTVVKMVKPFGIDPVSVENSVGPGTPDLNYLDGWLELKWARDWPKRDSTPLRMPHFTIQQRRWLARRQRAGGRAFVLLKVAREWLLFDGDTAGRILGESTRAELYDRAVAVWPKRMAWSQLVEEITR